MTQQEINRRNEAISKYMGAKTWERTNTPMGNMSIELVFSEYPQHIPDVEPPNLVEDCKYHSSLDWLMPVVEKIESEGCIIEITLCLGKMCRITKGSFKNPVKTIANIESNSTKEAVFLAVSDYCLKEINQ